MGRGARDLFFAHSRLAQVNKTNCFASPAHQRYFQYPISLRRTILKTTVAPHPLGFATLCEGGFGLAFEGIGRGEVSVNKR
jgi:hypothetical protein